jgi:hypothetical protein
MARLSITEQPAAGEFSFLLLDRRAPGAYALDLSLLEMLYAVHFFRSRSVPLTARDISLGMVLLSSARGYRGAESLRE